MYNCTNTRSRCTGSRAAALLHAPIRVAALVLSACGGRRQAAGTAARRDEGQPQLSRVRSLAALGLAALLLVVLAGLIALPLQAQAPSTVLVSNLGQAAGGGGGIYTLDQAQAFTTGDNTGGYTLTSVDIHIYSANNFDHLTVSIHSDSSGSPGGSLGTLTNPTSVASDDIQTFTASGSGITLAKETTYFIVLDAADSATGTVRNTASDSEDANPAANWSIGDASLYRNLWETGAWTSWHESKKIRINGTVAGGVTNSDPTFSSSTADREVAENTAAGQNVGAVLTASDSDGDTLTYTLEGTDSASFVLDTTTTAGSAQIQTKTGVTYNHEAKSSYTVVVKADDGGGGTAASVTVTITITDVNEAPERPAAPTVTATAGSTTSLSVSWTEPATTGPDIDDYDLRYRAGTSGNWSNGPQNVTATLASIGSLDAGTSYQVQVRATNNEGNSNWSLSGSGSTTAEATPTVSISADKTSAVFKQDGITYTLTRSGSTTGTLTVSVTLTQTKDFLLATELTKMVTIAAGQSTETFTVAASSFQHFAAGAMVEGGTLTAAVQDVLGYDLGSPSSVDVSIVIGATVRIELASSTVAEAGGTLAVKLIARTGAGAPQPTSNTSSLFFGAVDQTALNTIDYAFTDTSNDFQPSDFSMTSGVWQAELTFDITITNDAIDEDDETFDLKLEYQVGHQNSPLVDASGNSCGVASATVTVTITDDDTAGVTVSKTALTVTEQDASGDTYTVVLDSQPTADVTISDRRAVRHGRHRGSNPDDLHDVELGDGPDGDGDGRRRCGPGERHGLADPQRGEQRRRLPGHHDRRRDGDGQRQRHRAGAGADGRTGQRATGGGLDGGGQRDGLPGAVEVGRPGLQHQRPAGHDQLGLDHEPHDQQPQQRHRVHGAGQSDADRRQRWRVFGGGVGDAGDADGGGRHNLGVGADGDGAGVDRRQLHGGPRPPADGECDGDGGRPGQLGSDRQPVQPDLHDR